MSGAPLHAARTAAPPDPARTRRWLLATLLLLLAWEAAGLDRSVSQQFGNAQGFAWRDNWWLASVLHEGGRWLGLGLLTWLGWAAWRAGARPGPGPSRRERLYWLGVMLASALLVPALKRGSATSCPWDLAEFGGHAAYVSHWLWRVADGGPGHCFPSGHAVSAFALLGWAFQWRAHRPRRARALLAGVAAAGVVFGATQTVRGAHFVSHTLWSAWLCAAIAVAAETWLRRRPQAAAAATGMDGAGSTVPLQLPKPSRAAPGRLQ